MAELPKVVRIGDTLTNLIDKNTNQTITYTKVNNWWDGTPMTADKADGEIYRRKGVEYFLKNLGKYGELFLEKDTMQEMRDLSSTEILLLQMGYFKGVKLNGYYQEGDTPNPIEYTLSTSPITDNGGSVIELPSGVKLAHLFEYGVINMKYFGAVGDDVADDTDAFQNCIDFARNCTVNIPKGVYNITRRLTFPANWQVIFQGEGRASRRGQDFSSGDGIVKINFRGLASEGSAFHWPASGYFDGVLRNFYLRNESPDGVRNVDGIVADGRFTVTELRDITITGFRNGLRIAESFYYTEFHKCLFYNNDIGVLADAYEQGDSAFGNGARFNYCQLSGNRIGFRGRSIGELINFNNCYIEGNEQWGVSISGCKVVNIENSYIEFNGEDSQYASSQRGFFELSTSNGTGRNPSQMVFNVLKSFVFGRGENIIFRPTPSSSTDIAINFHNNMLVGNQNTAATLFRFPTTANANFTGVSLKGNSYFNDNYTDENLIFSNASLSAFKYIDSENDQLVTKVYPYLINRSTKDEVVGPNLGSGGNLNTDVASTKTINFPLVNTANASVNIFNNTNTSGTKTFNLYRGDGSNDVSIRFNAGIGSVDANEYRFSGVNRAIESGGINPEGSVSRTPGSMYLRASVGNERPYYKVGNGDSGWEPMAFLNDIPEEIILDPVSDITTPDATDEATAIALANDNKAKINELLAELRSKGLMNI